MKCNNSVVSILIAFAVVTTVQNATSRVRAMPQPWLVQLTKEQLDLVDGVCRAQRWPDLWFSSVRDGMDWKVVADLLDSDYRRRAWKKLRLIPKLLGCNYGVRFYWFLTLAGCVCDECRRSSQRNADVGNTGGGRRCWNELTAVLQGGSYTMFEVMRSLEYTHSTMGGNTDSDAFYQHLSSIRNFLCADEPPEGDDYVHQINNFTENLMRSLTFFCRPAYPRLDMDLLANEARRRFPSGNRYEYFVYLMKYYMDTVTNHLLQIGFHYDMGTDQLNFIYP